MTIWQILFYSAWCVGLYVHSLDPIEPTATPAELDDTPGSKLNVIG